MQYKPYYLKDVNKASKQNLFKVISTFAGGGGSSTGYKLAGGTILCVNEFVEEARNTYLANYPNTKILSDDIKLLTCQDFLDIANIKKYELDIFDGSPPCSAFSISGSRDAGWNKTKTYSDGKKVTNIEDLFFEFIRIANGIQPKIIIAENVEGLTIGTAKSKLYEILNSFDAIGYYCVHKILRAEHFETPTSRPRCIIVCIRKDVYDSLYETDLQLLSLAFPKENYDCISMFNAINDVINNIEEVEILSNHYINSNVYKNYGINLIKNPVRVINPSNPEYADWNPTGGYFGLKRPCPDLPCPTLLATGCQLSGVGVLHYNEERKLTIKELKRIMALPDDYKLTGTFNQQAERVGRMVAPRMMKSIAENIYENFIKPYNLIHKNNE